jgi:hypothetical protein
MFADPAATEKTSTASYLFENDYYIEDIITEDMSLVVTGGGESNSKTGTLSTDIISDNSGIVFDAIVDKSQTTMGNPFSGTFPHSFENDDSTGFRPVVNRNIQQSILDDRMILSDRCGNKLYLYTDDSGVKLSAFEVKPSISNPAITDPFAPVSETMLATINAVIKSANDIIGVI